MLFINLGQVCVLVFLQVLCKLTEAGTVTFVKTQHHFYDFTEIGAVRETLSQSLHSLSDKFFTVKFLALLVEACHVLHRCKLEKQQTHREDIALVDVMLGET
jgi:hypothetical protein